MIISTTPSLQGQKMDEYCGIVVGEAVMGANIFKDLFEISTILIQNQ